MTWRAILSARPYPGSSLFHHGESEFFEQCEVVLVLRGSVTERGHARADVRALDGITLRCSTLLA